MTEGRAVQIDHDPKELPHFAWKIVALITVAITLAIGLVVAMGIRWVVVGLPMEIVCLLFGFLMGGSAGFFIGQWDTNRQSRTPGSDG